VADGPHQPGLPVRLDPVLVADRGLDPIPHWKMSHGGKLANLLIGVPIESFLGLALLSTTRPAAPIYTVAGTTRVGPCCGSGPSSSLLGADPGLRPMGPIRGAQRARYDAQLDAEMAASALDRSGPPPESTDRRPLLDEALSRPPGRTSSGRTGSGRTGSGRTGSGRQAQAGQAQAGRRGRRRRYTGERGAL